jgi:hypothetical protein
MTGTASGADQMTEWVKENVVVILARKTNQVLGCIFGTSSEAM